MAPMEPSYADRYSDLYHRHWWWRSRERYVMRWVGRIAQGRRLKMLDIGCGDGFLWGRLAEHGDVEGIEPDPHLVPPESSRRARIEFSTFPGRTRTERYDVIFMLDVVEHIEDDRGALRAAYDLLAPGGHLIVTVPALMLLWSEFDVVNRHFRRYRRGALAKLMREVGLDVVSARYYYFWPVLPLLLRRALFRAQNHGQSKFLEVPPRPVNAALETLSNFDHWATRIVPVPFGGSIIAVGKKPASGPA
jgi:SAM-dependent methyltransferase